MSGLPLPIQLLVEDDNARAADTSLSIESANEGRHNARNGGDDASVSSATTTPRTDSSPWHSNPHVVVSLLSTTTTSGAPGNNPLSDNFPDPRRDHDFDVKDDGLEAAAHAGHGTDGNVTIHNLRAINNNNTSVDKAEFTFSISASVSMHAAPHDAATSTSSSDGRRGSDPPHAAAAAAATASTTATTTMTPTSSAGVARSGSSSATTPIPHLRPAVQPHVADGGVADLDIDPKAAASTAVLFGGEHAAPSALPAFTFAEARRASLRNDGGGRGGGDDTTTEIDEMWRAAAVHDGLAVQNPSMTMSATSLQRAGQSDDDAVASD